MNVRQIKILVKLLGLVGVIVALHACSSEPSPWAKSESPWDQRNKEAAAAPAPAAETYKADLEMPAESANEVELSYQPETVESFAPEVAVDAAAPEEEVVVAAVEEEPVTEGGSIMDQPANYYTMQLMASVDIDRVYRFAEQNQLSTEYVVPTVRDGVTWYVLLLGVYPDYSSAVAARDEIAPSLKTEPWIRRVSSVQKLVQ